MRKLPREVNQKISIWNEEVKDNYKNIESFQIDIDYIVGRTGDKYLYFDSVISHMVAEYVLGEWLYILSPDHDEQFNLKLPIKKECRRTNHWFYECGGMFNQPEQVTHWTKRFEKMQLQTVKNKRISTKGGEFKSYRMPTLYDNKKKYRIISKGTYYLVEKIFHTEYNVSKRAAIGFGEAKLKLKKSHFKTVLWFDRKLLRPIPIAFFKDKNIVVEGEQIYCSIHPPYYGRNSKQFLCYNFDSIVI